MKPKLILFLALLLAGLSTKAQFAPFYFGLKAAPQIAWLKPDVDNWKGDGVKIGFAWGFIAEKNFTENHSFATGFNMIFNGGKLKYPTSVDGSAGILNRNYFLKYIEIPLTLKMRTNDLNGTRYFGRIGLGTAFRIGSKVTDEFTTAGGVVSTYPKKNYDKVNFARESLIVGAGGEFEISGGPKLGVELTFNNGFTNILTATNERATPNYFELAVSVLF